MELKKKLIETEWWLAAVEGGWEKLEDVGQRVQILNYKMDTFWGSNVQHETMGNNWNLLRV